MNDDYRPLLNQNHQLSIMTVVNRLDIIEITFGRSMMTKSDSNVNKLQIVIILHLVLNSLNILTTLLYRWSQDAIWLQGKSLSALL